MLTTTISTSARLSRLAAAHRPRVVTPLGNDAIMRYHDPAIAAEAYDWHEPRRYRHRHHGDARADAALVGAKPVRPQHVAVGLVRDRGAGRTHLSWSPIPGYGDGEHFHGARERHGPFRLAVLPIGAYEPRWFMRDQHMNPAEAVQAFVDCGAERALGHHYGTFQLTDEAIDAPLIALAHALSVAGDSGRAFPRFAARRGVPILAMGIAGSPPADGATARVHLIMTKTLTTRFSSLVVSGSVTYCSMNMSLASSRFSSRKLVIAS